MSMNTLEQKTQDNELYFVILDKFKRYISNGDYEDTFDDAIVIVLNENESLENVSNIKVFTNENLNM